MSLKHWFTIAKYNDALVRLTYPSYESGDKPCPVPEKSNVRKLKGKAVSHWVHLRNWPLVMRRLVDDNFDDPVLNLGLILHNIVERLCALEFLSYEISSLNDKIIEYLELRKSVRKDFPNLMPNPKPKHHFLRKKTFHCVINVILGDIITLKVKISSPFFGQRHKYYPPLPHGVCANLKNIYLWSVQIIIWSLLPRLL